MSARIISKFLSLLAIAALTLVSYWSLRLAYADWLFRVNTPASVARAVELDPGNAQYHAWLAEIHEYEGLNPAAELEIASKLNPSDSAVWIRRGLVSESRHDFTTAEEFLLHAARIDKLYAPRWTLANYYARTGDSERFWPWARQALETGYDDLGPVFRLCWIVSQDGALIRSRAIPRSHSVLGKYLNFLTQQDRLEAAEPIASDFLEQIEAGDAAIALNFCDRLIERKRMIPAVGVWNKLHPSPPLSPERGIVLTNGDFRTAPVQQGFDWRTTADPDISVTRAENPPAFRFHLSGKQPENCELMSQIIPLAPDRKYSFNFEYKTLLTGLRWRIAGTSISLSFRDDEWRRQQVIFASGNSLLERLTLVYDRESGSTRAEGEIWLRNATIAFAK